jgi:hypothetical protein
MGKKRSDAATQCNLNLFFTRQHLLSFRLITYGCKNILDNTIKIEKVTKAPFIDFFFQNRLVQINNGKKNTIQSTHLFFCAT